MIDTARGETIGGEWKDETVIGGTGVFTPDGKICTFVKTTEYTLGFVGTYTFDGRVMRQSLRASSNQAFEGRTQERAIQFIEPDYLRLSAVDDVTGLKYELTMRRTNTVS